MEATMISEGMLDGEEAVFPCKGCGEILEEGKAFELAGNRWHIDCFRCNSCRTLLDSDANLLLLGDGSLICNNCTYSCSVCKQKIEDLAILTGEKQAFCARCFRCRNCKRKIENLKYAKTSQGIFCMQCHESLMARRRKKNQAKAAAAGTTRTPSSASSHAPLVDKSLPALPPHIATQALSPETDLRSPPESSANSESTGLPTFSDFQLEHSAKPFDEKDTVLLSPRAYGDAPLDSQSEATQDTTAEDDGFSIPVALDPSPIQPPPRRRGVETNGRDFYASSQQSSANARTDFADLLGPASRSHSSDRQRSRSRGSPHVAYQEKGRVPSMDSADTMRRRQESGSSTPSSMPRSSIYSPTERSRFSPLRELEDPLTEKFRLQPAPKRRSSGAKGPDHNHEGQHVASITRTSPIESGSGHTLGSGIEHPLSDDVPYPKHRTSSKRSPLASPSLDQSTFERPPRDASMKKQSSQQRQPQEEQEARAEPPQLPTLQIAPQASIGQQELVHDKPFAKNSLSASSPLIDKDGLPARNPRRPLSGPMSAAITPDKSREEVATAQKQSTPTKQLGNDLGHFHKGSVTSIQTDSLDYSRPQSPVVSANAATDPSPEDAQEAGKDGLLRSFSKAVRHARSQSDKVATSPKWQKTRNQSVDISSPHPASSAEGENVELRNKLRYSQQRITELEADKIALQAKVNGNDDIIQVNTELSQKRSTMAMIDSQREMVMRELEVMTEQLQRIKSNSGMVDIDQLRSDVMRDFGVGLEKLKMQVAEQIEELMAKKNDLTKEITDLIQMKDRGNQEYDSLSNRNRELARHNDQLIASIQSIYQQQAKSNGTGGSQISQGQNVQGGPASNGLGIYAHNKEPSFDGRSADNATQYSGTTYGGDIDYDQAGIVSQPQLVNMRKGQPRKFISWKKGRETVAKNVTKGFKGAFGSTQNTLREETLTEGVPYGSIPATEPPPQTGTTPLAPSRGGLDSKGHQGWGFKGGILGQPPARPLDRSRDTPPSSTVHTAPSSSTSATAASNALSMALPADTHIFGSDLTSRCEFEKRVIPSIVMSCIDEVSMRGLEEEGIYRKSGSSTQVKAIQAGFERDHANYDISDADLDIHAVTGCLKQYFRRLPNPLITFECYDAFLECVRDEGTTELQKVLMIKEVVTMLPKCHRETLEFLCFHLCGVMEKQTENLMTPLNLAVVFAPTIMRPLSIEREIADTGFQRAAVQVLIENFAAVFEPPESAS